jgi:hypothetical protein
MVILRLYAEVKGLGPRASCVHIRYLKTVQYWILERLELFSFNEGTDAVRQAVLLELKPDKVVNAVDVVLGTFRARPEDAALLPPLLTLPEKLVVLEALASELKEALTRPGVLKSWLYVLRLAAPGGPTRLGRALRWGGVERPGGRM